MIEEGSSAFGVCEEGGRGRFDFLRWSCSSIISHWNRPFVSSLNSYHCHGIASPEHWNEIGGRALSTLAL